MSLLACDKFESICFIGGSTQVFDFEMIGKDGEPLDLTGSTIKWVVFPYGRPDEVLYTKTSASIDEIEVTGENTFSVHLKDTESEILRGKFIHRPIIRDLLGNQHIPSEGIMIIE